jgi:drug/metabolite transporter (DMT)-like permease
MKSRKLSLGFLLAFGATILGGSSYIFAGEARKGLNPESSLLYWYLFALFSNLLFISARGKLASFRKRKNLDVFILIGGINTVFGLLYFYLIDTIGTNATALYNRLSTVFIVLLAFIFLKERAHRDQLIGMAIAISGALILSFSPELGLNRLTLIALICILSLAIADVCVKHYVAFLEPEIITATRLAGSIFFCLVFGLLFGSFQSLSWQAVPWVLAGGTVSAFGRFYLYYEAIKRIDVSKAAVIMVFEPVVTVVINILAYQIFPSTQKMIGGITIVFGVFVLTYQSIRNKDEKNLIKVEEWNE